MKSMVFVLDELTRRRYALEDNPDVGLCQRDVVRVFPELGRREDQNRRQ